MEKHTMVMAPDSPLAATLRTAEVLARRDCPIFVRGESGSGKEALARHLHSSSLRAQGPFIAVNCAALPPHLIESELFGHRRGAFTGAHADSPGKFRLADKGSIFLDEVGDMPPEVQSRLLRVLQEKTVCPVGDGKEYPVDFRLIAATHRDLRKEVSQGRFREDLYYRLNVIEIRIPPLRERPGDIPHLLRHFLSGQLTERDAQAALSQLPAALLQHPFPGNIRELKNLAERYCALRELGADWSDVFDAMRTSDGRTVSVMLPQKNPPPCLDLAETLRRIRNSRVSDAQILNALNASGYHRARASALLGISRRALQYRLVKMGERFPTLGMRADSATPA